MVTFGGLTHYRKRQLDRSKWRSVPQLRTYQSEGKENTDDQKHGDHYRATEEASAGFGPASSGP